jgi:hypothetical protein
MAKKFGAALTLQHVVEIPLNRDSARASFFLDGLPRL